MIHNHSVKKKKSLEFYKNPRNSVKQIIDKIQKKNI